MTEQTPMKPMIVIPVGCMTAEDRKLLNDNGLCVVEAKDPAAVRFIDPIPCVSSRSQIEHAAIQLSRKLLSYTTPAWPEHGGIGYERVSRLFIELLVQGTPLDQNPTPEEMLAKERRWAKEQEARELGRLEAKAERDAKKAAAAKVEKAVTKK